MESRYDRTEALIGKEALSRVMGSRVAVFGIGGVGGYAVEALARAGVGTLDLIDSDRVSVSNINRQIIALDSTVGKYKTEAAKDRIRDINPDITVNCYNFFYDESTADKINLTDYDYVIDAIDSVGAKLFLIESCTKSGVKIISSMGTGAKLDPTALKVSDISKTSVCPLARAVRTGLRKRGINRLRVVYSTELPRESLSECGEKCDGKRAPASSSFVPSVAGLILAGEVIRDISEINKKTASEEPNENQGN